MQKDRFDEQEAQELLMMMPGALGYCQYDGEKPEHGYLVIATTPGGVVRAMGRQALRQWRIVTGSLSVAQRCMPGLALDRKDVWP